MRSALLAMIATLAACATAASDARRPSPGLQIRATAAPDCNYVMTVPPLPGAAASVDAAGRIQLVVFAYVRPPVSVTASAAGTTVEVELTSTAADETFCKIPLEITGLAPRPSAAHVRIHHGGGRPLTDLTIPIR